MTIAPVRGRAAAGASAPAVAAAPTTRIPKQRDRRSKAPSAPRVDFDDLVREQQFEMLVRDHRRRITGIIYRHCGSWTDAEEAVQEALLRLWSKRQQLDSVNDLAAWLVNESKWAVRQIRTARAKACPALLGEHIERVEDQQPVEPSTGPCLADPEIMDRVREALATVPVERRRVVELHCLQGLSIAEVAAQTGKTRAAVSQALYAVLRLHKNWSGPKWQEQFVNDPEAEALRTQVRLLAKLPPRTREVVWLRYVDGLSLVKVADRLGLSQRMVSQHLNRARQLARVELAEADQ